MRVRLSAVVALGVLLGVAWLLAPSAGAESSPSAFGSRLVTLINEARAQHGLKAVTVANGTSTVALNWTNHLDGQQALSHNPGLGHQLETHGSPNWTAYGENVGDGPTSSADTLFQAYMNSPEHRDNILGSAYRYVGVGVVFDGSTAWNTLDFVDQYSSSTTTSRPRTTTTTHSSPAPAKPAPRPAAHHAAVVVHHVTSQSTARPKPQPRPVRRPQVRAVAPKAPVAKRAAAPVAVAAAAPAAVPATTVSVAMLPPMHLPHNGRNTAPYAAAAAAILLVVASRYVLEVFPRGA